MDFRLGAGPFSTMEDQLLAPLIYLCTYHSPIYLLIPLDSNADTYMEFCGIPAK